MIIKDVIGAMKKNGLPLHQRSYIKYNDNGEPVAACIWGQAGRNLNISPPELQSAVSKALGIKSDLTSSIVRMNDFADPDHINFMAAPVPTTYEKVVAYAERVLSPYADLEVVLPEGVYTFEEEIAAELI